MLNNVWSSVLENKFGARQGSVLSPFLLAVYLDDLCRLESVIGNDDADDENNLLLYILKITITRNFKKILYYKCNIRIT